tara:strand:- start:713 stop:859 length:147 start_codon:yes stop_codon:yes gene_type:complete
MEPSRLMLSLGSNQVETEIFPKLFELYDANGCLGKVEVFAQESEVSLK